MAQLFISGIFEGIQIALLALAISLVLRPTGILHLSLGGVWALAPYLAQSLRLAGVPWAAALGVPVLVAAGVSSLTDLLNHRLLDRRKVSSSVHIISALGIYIALVQGISLAWGDSPEAMRDGASASVHLPGLVTSRAQLAAVGASALGLTAGYTALYATRFGLLLRAAASNAEELALRGHRVDLLRLGAFALSGACCGVAALATAYDIGFDAYSGLDAVLLGVVACIVGGRGSFLGPLAGGIVVGLLRSSVGWCLSAAWRDAATFALLGGVLLVRPSGLLGVRARLEASE